jgi:hypothetical protein
MPESLTIGAFVLGGVLLLIALVGGGFKIFGAEVSGRADPLPRLLSGVLGLMFVLVGISGAVDNGDPPAPRQVPTPLPAATAVEAGIAPVSRTPAPAGSGLQPASLASAPPSPPNTCPVIPAMVWMQFPETWYGPFAGGDAVGFHNAGGFDVWLANAPNAFGTRGAVISYPDPMLAIPRNVWVPLNQSGFRVCVDAAGYVFAVQG